MKVGIVTFQHANNYGALLQSYALQKAVKKYGNECDVIAYASEYIEKPYHLLQLKRKGIVAYIIGTLGYLCYLPRKKACSRFRKLIDYSERVDENSVKNIENNYDIFICGSDQVWNYKLTGGDMNFMLNFVSDAKKKNSYAASIGISEIEPFMQEAYKENLKSFHHISVREKRAQEILQELGDIESTVVVDPTLLLNAKEWESLIEKGDTKEEYIVVYQLGISKRLTSYVQALSKEKKVKVKYIPFPLGGYVKSKAMLKAGPYEWLKLFKEAKYVVTDSFHGVVFSLIFHKQFVVEVNERNKNVGGRIYELLSKVGLGHRIINVNADVDIDEKMDFETADSVIEEQRKLSYLFLEKILSE